MTTVSREELLELADEEAAARARYHETDAVLIRESEVREYALRLAAKPADDDEREATIEECARIADRMANRDAAYSARHPDEAHKFDNRAHRARTVAIAIRSLSTKAKP